MNQYPYSKRDRDDYLLTNTERIFLSHATVRKAGRGKTTGGGLYLGFISPTLARISIARGDVHGVNLDAKELRKVAAALNEAADELDPYAVFEDTEQQ